LYRYTRYKKDKGVWRMPRLSEAKKDVISCEKLGVSANNCSSQDIRMGQPVYLKNRHHLKDEANPEN